jgi:phospholipid N-methyltransferase
MTAVAQPVRLELASRWQRFLGQMIDSVFAGLPMAMLPAIVNHVPSLTGVNHQRPGDKAAGTVVIVAD